MSETNQTAENQTEIKAQENIEQSRAESKEADPYCCTPIGGGSGPDTKP
jgi:hypothetical protein